MEEEQDVVTEGRPNRPVDGGPLARDERRRRRAYLVMLTVAGSTATILLVVGAYQDPFVTAIRVVVVASLSAVALVWSRVVPLRLVERGLLVAVLASLAAVIAHEALLEACDLAA